MNFDWHTEEDDGWDDPNLASSGSDENKPDGKRPFWRWLLLFGLLVVALTAAGWTLNRRVQTATGQVEGDVLASYALVEQAIAQQDDEVFQSLLSGRDDVWANGMARAVLQGSLTDRSGLGLLHVPGVEPVTPTVEMAADLLEAEVKTIRPYTIEVGNGLTETIALEQTAVYRLGSNRWLLSPPDIAFWGGVGQLKGRYVTLFYPERDKDFAQLLLLKLDEIAFQLCTGFCVNTYSLIVELDTDPAAFDQLDLSSVVATANTRQMMLPAPSLVGLPVDTAAEMALLRGYGQLAAGAMLADMWDYYCCAHEVVFQAILADPLRRLGLQSWPGGVGTAVAPADYDALLASNLSLNEAAAILWADDGIAPDGLVDVFVDFALTELQVSHRALADSLSLRRENAEEWLLSMSQDGENAGTFQEMERMWLQYVYRNSSLAQQEPPVPLPEQDIELLCRIGDEERRAFYRYNLADGSTQLEQPLNREVKAMVALPDDTGLAVWEAGFNEGLTGMFLWMDGVKTAVSWDATDNAPGPVPMRADPANSKMLLAPAVAGRSHYGLLDAMGCLDSVCQLDILNGYPVWSPDLTHMILLSTENFRAADSRAHMAQARGGLILADGLGEEIEVVGAGSSPFWLNNEAYGFVMDAGEGRRNTVLTGRIGEDGTEVLLTVADLTAGMSDDHLRLIDFIAVHPKFSNRLVVVTIDVESDEDTFDWFKEAQPGATLFVYDLEAGETVLTHPFAADMAFNRSYRFSPNGRFLLLGEGAEYRPTVLHLIDLENGTADVVPLQAKYLDSIYWYTDWSAAGDWLLVVDDGFVHVLYPGSEYERLVIPTTGQCETAVWVNK